MAYWYCVKQQINQVVLLAAWVIILLDVGRYFGGLHWRFSNVATVSFVVTKIFFGAFLCYRYPDSYSDKIIP